MLSPSRPAQDNRRTVRPSLSARVERGRTNSSHPPVSATASQSAYGWSVKPCIHHPATEKYCGTVDANTMPDGINDVQGWFQQDSNVRNSLLASASVSFPRVAFVSSRFILFRVVVTTACTCRPRCGSFSRSVFLRLIFFSPKYIIDRVKCPTLLPPSSYRRCTVSARYSHLSLVSLSDDKNNILSRISLPR